MTIKRASEIRTWRETPVGARCFLARDVEAVLEKAPNRPTVEQVEAVLAVLALMCRNDKQYEQVRLVLGLPHEPPDR